MQDTFIFSRDPQTSIIVDIASAKRNISTALLQRLQNQNHNIF